MLMKDRMTYANLMVNLELGADNHNLIRVTGQLAERFNANVIGVVGCSPMQMPYGDGYINGDLMKDEFDRTQAEMLVLETEFRTSLQSIAGSLSWRSSAICSSIADYVVGEACIADLLIAKAADHVESESTRHMNNGDVLMQLGRPMMLVPASCRELHLQTMMIAWKDTMESRRAIYDALPMLKKATKVILMEITPIDEENNIKEQHAVVIEWLARHQIKAISLTIVAADDEAERLREIATEMNVDLLVAGAYGHSRIREWVAGGMTREILQSQTYCSMLSH